AALGACSSAPAPAAGPAPAAAADTTPAVAAAPARQPPPPPLEARPIQFPAFTETTLPNGLRVMTVQNRRLPVANVALYVESGSANDPQAKLGLASLAAELLDNGTARRSAEQIAETIEGVGGTLSTGADRDDVTISAGVLSDQLPLAFDLVSDVALRPTFPADELETVRRQQLSALQVALGDAGQIAQRRFNREVYGADHPYGLAPTPETVRAVTRNDLVQFHRAHFTPRNALLVVSGDVTPEQVQQLATRHFGSWRGGAAPEPQLAAPAMRDRAGIVLVHRPGSVQSSVRVGHPGITPDNPDYYALQVMNAVLGSLPTSRLERIIRGERAWTYSARSTFTRPEATGVFVGNTEVRTPVTDSALVEMLAQFRRIREEPVPQAELDAAKSFLTGSFPLRFETPAATASQLAQTRLLGLPAESLQQFPQRVAAVTAEDVQRVAQKYLHPDRATIVVVGDATQVLKPLEAVGPVALFDVEGRPLERSAIEVRASTESFDASSLQPAKLAYTVSVQGNPMGTANTTLAREGSAWVATQTLQLGPNTTNTEVRFTGDLSPISAKQTMNARGMDLGSELTYADGRVKGSAKLPPQMGGEKTFDTEVVAGTRFAGMDAWVLAAADLAPGKTISYPVFAPQTGGVVPVTLTVAAEEKVTVPAGTFDAYRVEIASDQPATAWVRKDEPHVLLKLQQKTVPVVLELQSVQ
ncbi:MAG TPA: insulinase family protein, partial [Longimicrobiaceae bacterium]|nr:insulinase family protein [Longimicrobiaceae bacterium]